MSRTCSGSGVCLSQNCDPSIPSAYVKYSDTTCEHNCEPVKCPNFAVCREICPKWVLSCHGGRCLHCNMFFGKNLTFKDDPEECPVCMEVAPCVVQPNCSHSTCIACFRRCRFDGPPREAQPPFPYPDREDEYDDLDCPDELYNDPLVIAWNDELNRQDDERSLRYEAEKSLRACPLCRK
jgi:hypothetical protein